MNGHTDSFYKDLMIIGVIDRSGMAIHGKQIMWLMALEDLLISPIYSQGIPPKTNVEGLKYA